MCRGFKSLLRYHSTSSESRCSQPGARTSRVFRATGSVEVDPTAQTLVRRVTSRFTRASGFVEAIGVQGSPGKIIPASMDLHRFRSGPLTARLAIKETGDGSNSRRRVQSGMRCASRLPVAWDDVGLPLIQGFGFRRSAYGIGRFPRKPRCPRRMPTDPPPLVPRS